MENLNLLQQLYYDLKSLSLYLKLNTNGNNIHLHVLNHDILILNHVIAHNKSFGPNDSSLSSDFSALNSALASNKSFEQSNADLSDSDADLYAIRSNASDISDKYSLKSSASSINDEFSASPSSKSDASTKSLASSAMAYMSDIAEQGVHSSADSLNLNPQHSDNNNDDISKGFSSNGITPKFYYKKIIKLAKTKSGDSVFHIIAHPLSRKTRDLCGYYSYLTCGHKLTANDLTKLYAVVGLALNSTYDDKVNYIQDYDKFKALTKSYDKMVC